MSRLCPKLAVANVPVSVIDTMDDRLIVSRNASSKASSGKMRQVGVRRSGLSKTEGMDGVV
jgi:hypothetical protein